MQTEYSYHAGGGWPATTNDPTCKQKPGGMIYKIYKNGLSWKIYVNYP
jgi:hypothetical protein